MNSYHRDGDVPHAVRCCSDTKIDGFKKNKFVMSGLHQNCPGTNASLVRLMTLLNRSAKLMVEGFALKLKQRIVVQGELVVDSIIITSGLLVDIKEQCLILFRFRF